MAQVNAAPDEENLSMCEHLERRGTRYSIRRKIPVDLVSHYGGKSMFTKALDTSDFSEAKKRCRLLAVELDREWDSVRQTLNAEQSLSNSAPAEMAAPVRVRTAQEINDWERSRDEHDELAAHEEMIAGYEYEEREQMRQAFREVIAEDGLMRAVAAVGFDSGAFVSSAGMAPQKSSASAGTRLAAVVDKWAAERKPTDRTATRTRRIVEEFEQHCGKLLLEKVTKAHILQFKDALLADGQTPANINTKIPMLGTVFNFACDNAMIPVNPASRVRVADKRKANEKRLNFEDAHIKAIFSGLVYTGGELPKAAGGAAAYWLPLLALFTGGRLNELGQLRPSDVYEESYVDHAGTDQRAWVIRITSDRADGMDVKTNGSVRRVPVHPKLIELGLVEFVATTRDNPRIFHAITLDRDGKITGTWGKWFINQYLRKDCGIPRDKRWVFHSFRHTFKHLARLAGIPKEVNDAFAGHTSGDAADSYGGLSYPLAPLVENMKLYRVAGLPLQIPT